MIVFGSFSIIALIVLVFLIAFVEEILKDMEVLFRRFDEKYARTDVLTLRLYANTIDWDSQLICIIGARGVGKTTMVLQHIKKTYKSTNEVLYTSLDHNYFLDNKLYNLAETFHKKGGKLLVLDEYIVV